MSELNSKKLFIKAAQKKGPPHNNWKQPFNSFWKRSNARLTF